MPAVLEKFWFSNPFSIMNRHKLLVSLLGQQLLCLGDSDSSGSVGKMKAELCFQPHEGGVGFAAVWGRAKDAGPLVPRPGDLSW